jgi:hypothetical protein
MTRFRKKSSLFESSSPFPVTTRPSRRSTITTEISEKLEEKVNFENFLKLQQLNNAIEIIKKKIEDRTNKEITILANFFSEYIPYFKKLRKNLNSKENYIMLLKTFSNFIKY